MNDHTQESEAHEFLLQSLLENGGPSEELPENLVLGFRKLALYSSRLSTLCLNKPFILKHLAQDNLKSPRSLQDLYEQLSQHQQEESNPLLALRNFHRTEIIRVAMRDFCELAQIETLAEELSHLADVVIQTVFDCVSHKLIHKFGEPYSHEHHSPAHMCVVGLGKLGGQELNFSSDIDLMFVYDYEGETTGGSEGILDNKKFFTLLVQEVSDILCRPTPEGFLYRVDLRLRPEGDRGAIAVPLMAVELYYHSYGQNWERQSLLKARVVAGSQEVGKKFIKLITPFTYRKYVDEVEIAEVIRSIDSMRMRSLHEIKSEELRWRNFKNGYGGIRDIEFFVQAVQLLYGGQYPEIKLTGTLVTLLRLHQSHLLHSMEYGVLALAYKLLRRIEHHLQMVGEQQVYDLPATTEAQKQLADSLGYPSWDSFWQDYRRNTQAVRKIYEGVFKRQEFQDVAEIIIDSEQFNESVDRLLASYELEDTKKAFTFLKSLQQSSDAHLQLKITRLFKAYLPRLLQYIKNSPDPDLALFNFEKLVASFRAKSALYQSFCDEPPLLDLLVSVTSSSSFLTRLLLRDPSLMEFIGHTDFLNEVITKNVVHEHLRLMNKAYPNAPFRDILLRVQNASMLRSGIRFILGLTDVEHMGRELANVADFVLEQSLPPVTETLRERYPEFTQKYAHELAVIGFGKLGGREFNVASDCDLVFVYPEHHQTDEITSSEYFQRWGSKYIDYLQQKGVLGFLYHVDTRLRPHGQNSPMASSMNSMFEYYRNDAQYWEKMALTRARFVCGNPDVELLLRQLKEEVLFSSSCSRDEIQQVLDMRHKIAREKQDETLKAAPGGLIDVEFIAQTLVLCYGASHPAIRSTSTITNIRNAREAGVMDERDASQLLESYLFLREVENRLRIVNNISLDALPGDPDEMVKLTRRYSLRLDSKDLTAEKFQQMILYHTRNVRRIFDTFYGQLLKS
ncbi:MAG: bifunctional [glutamate--ammonia ligase]-adenylyl-L-tyrosine phosphorylase/[glutamate--ammonia-ligase] adenylyltransferase [bacterium]|jgi:glutamate-ammonia-ligase adenylyltransferase